MLECNLWYDDRRIIVLPQVFGQLDGAGLCGNPYDPCVWNKVIKGKQSTICFHVDDCKISHMSAKVNDITIEWLRRDYESIFMDGSGEMKVAQGKVHTHLGMKLDFSWCSECLHDHLYPGHY